MEAIQRRHRSHARRTTSIFNRRARQAALAEAEGAAQGEIQAAERELVAQAQEYQRQLDSWWASLAACDPDTVLTALAEAFEDNEAAAAAVGVDDREVSLVVLIPSVSVIPERKPTLTQAGNLSLKKLTKTETADLYKLLVCGHVLVTLREAFAVVPGIQSARIVAVRPSPPDAYGDHHPEVIAAASCHRAALNDVRWGDVDAARVFNDCCTDKLLIQRGAVGALQPIPLENEPELRALLNALDMDDLLTD